MSIRTVSERIKQQNELLIVMAGNEEANSTLMRQSLEDMKEVLIGIQKVLSDQDTEEDTEESRRKLQDKDKDDPKKPGFLGRMFSGNDKKDGKGLLGGIFSKALGLLVKSLPLIGLASMFFGDIVSGLFAAALGDYDAGALAQRMLTGGLLGSFFGVKGALIGALLGAILTPEAKEQLLILKDWLVENGPSMLSWFAEGLTSVLTGINGILSGDILGNLGTFVGLIGLLALNLAPLKTVSLLAGLVKLTWRLGKFIFGLIGLPALFGRVSASIAAMYAAARMGGRLGPNGMGPPLPPGGRPPAGGPNPAPPRSGGRVSGFLRGAGSLLSRGARGVGGALLTGVMMAPGVVTSAARTAGSVIASGASAAGSAVRSGVSTAVPAVRGAAGGLARSLTGPAAKTAIKKVPVIGALAALGFGASRLFKGDPVGAGLEIASGVASIFPGIGTAASLGIDAALIARDVSKNKTQELSSAIDNKSEVLNDATRERDELVAKTSSNVIMDNSTTNNVSSGGGGSISMSGPISWHDNHDPYSGHA